LSGFFFFFLPFSIFFSFFLAITVSFIFSKDVYLMPGAALPVAFILNHQKGSRTGHTYRPRSLCLV
jgi:hypothetical protein